MCHCHKHCHTVCSEHTLKECKTCNMVYCENCGKEWGGTTNYWSYPIYQIPTWTNKPTAGTVIYYATAGSNLTNN